MENNFCLFLFFSLSDISDQNVWVGFRLDILNAWLRVISLDCLGSCLREYMTHKDYIFDVIFKLG